MPTFQSARRASLVAILVIAIANAASAQNQPILQPAQPAQGANEQDRIVLKDATKIVMRNPQTYSSKYNKVGDPVEFAVSAPVIVDGMVVIQEHAKVSGRVVSVARPRSMNRAGKIGVELNEVTLVTGEKAKVRARVKRDPGNQTGEILAEFSIYAVFFLPWILKEQGSDVELFQGTRVEGYIEGDYVLDRGTVQSFQTLVAPPSKMGVVYVYRPTTDLDSTRFGLLKCGKRDLGVIERGSMKRIEVPPGKYWFSAGYSRQFFDAHYPADPKSVVQLEIDGGHTYYLRIWLRENKRSPKRTPRLEPVDTLTGVADLAQTDFIAEYSLDKVTSEQLDDMHVQEQPTPETLDGKKARRKLIG